VCRWEQRGYGWSGDATGTCRANGLKSKRVSGLLIEQLFDRLIDFLMVKYLGLSYD
jgi:hypothetical protein